MPKLMLLYVKICINLKKNITGNSNSYSIGTFHNFTQITTVIFLFLRIATAIIISDPARTGFWQKSQLACKARGNFALFFYGV